MFRYFFTNYLYRDNWVAEQDSAATVYKPNTYYIIVHGFEKHPEVDLLVESGNLQYNLLLILCIE